MTIPFPDRRSVPANETAAHLAWLISAILLGLGFLWAGLDRDRWITPHSLRHCFGSHMAMAGVPMRKLQLLMGHSSSMVTERWYAHCSPDYLKGATDVLSTPAQPLPADRTRPATSGKDNTP